MNSKLKKAAVPFLASLIMVLGIGGYFTYAANIDKYEEHPERYTTNNNDDITESAVTQNNPTQVPTSAPQPTQAPSQDVQGSQSPTATPNPCQ